MIFALNHPDVLKIPIEECGEQLLDLRQYNQILLGPSPEIPNNQDYTKLRKTVFDLLCKAQEKLPNNMKFCLYEGYRSLDLQEKLFSDRYKLIKDTHSDWGHDSVFNETVKLVSPLMNLDGSVNVPPHSTGGAFDVYLVDETEAPIDMGLFVGDWMKDIDGTISMTQSSKISDLAQQNRNIMSKVLDSVGFANYAGEYWHWSYGDRYWAFMKGKKSAIYGAL